MKKAYLATLAAAIAALTVSAPSFAGGKSEPQPIVSSDIGVHPYIGVRNGAAFSDMNVHNCDDDDYDANCSIDDDTVYTVNPYVGLQFPINQSIALSTDIEYFWHGKADMEYRVWKDAQKITDKASIKVNGGYVNFYATFIPKMLVSPYVGAGFGFARTEADISSQSSGSHHEKNTNFAYHADVGAILNVNDHLAFDLTLRYSDYGKVVKNFYRESLDLDDIELLGGVKFTF